MKQNLLMCLHFFVSLNEAMPLVIRQLQQLWHLSMLSIVFEPLLSYVSMHAAANSGTNSKEALSSSSQKKGTSNFVKESLWKNLPVWLNVD